MAESPPFDASDPKAVEARKKEAKLATARKRETVRALMSTEDGRAWFYDILVFCHVFTTSFSSTSPYQTAFNCGEQNIGLAVIADLQESCPDLYLQMMKEQNNENS